LNSALVTATTGGSFSATLNSVATSTGGTTALTSATVPTTYAPTTPQTAVVTTTASPTRQPTPNVSSPTISPTSFPTSNPTAKHVEPEFSAGGIAGIVIASIAAFLLIIVVPIIFITRPDLIPGTDAYRMTKAAASPRDNTTLLPYTELTSTSKTTQAPVAVTEPQHGTSSTSALVPAGENVL